MYTEATLQDEEAEVGPWWGRWRGEAEAVAEEEEDTSDYSPNSARKGRAAGPKKGGGAARAAAEEEEDATDYSPTQARKGRDAGPKKGGGAARAAAEEEEDATDYSPTQARKGRAAAPKKTTQAQEGGPSHPNRKKDGGPCALCLTTSKPSSTASPGSSV